MVIPWIDEARDRIYTVAHRRSLVPRDFASTVICAIAVADQLVVAHIGDGCLVVHDKTNNVWVAPTWPDHGEYASTTRFITDDPCPALRISRHVGPVDALVMFTDGLERLALDFATVTPHTPFLSGICGPLYGTSTKGRNHPLSEKLKTYLGSPAVNARTDDDKTLVLAVRQ